MAVLIAPPSSSCCCFTAAGMGSLAGTSMCCVRDHGGAGAFLMSLLYSRAPLGKQPLGRGNLGLGGYPFGGGIRNWFPGQPVEQYGAVYRDQGWQLNVAADHSGSKPEAHKRRGKWGYHPLEELTKQEREAMQAGNGRPSNADIARTISEVHWNAVIFSSVVSDEDPVFGTGVQYLVDEHGDLFFEMNDDNEFLSSLSALQTFTVLIGFGSMDEIQVSEMVEEVGEDEDEDSDLMEDDSDDSEDEDNLEDVDIRFWEELAPGAAEAIQEGVSPESLGSLGGWGGPDTLAWVHPMEFASKIAQAVSTDYTEEINKPTKRLTISGFVRKVTEEEEPYVQSLWYDSFLWNEEDDGEGEEDSMDDEEDASEEAEKDKIIRTHQTVVNGSSRGPAQGQGKGKSSRSGMKRPANKDASKGNGQRQRNGSLRPSSTSDFTKSNTLPSSEVINGHNISETENRLSGSTELSRSNDMTTQVGSRKEDVEIDELGCEGLVGSSKDGEDVIGGEWTEESTSGEVSTTFFKLEMTSMQLDSSSGIQTPVEIHHFRDGLPDILAHSAAAIIERVNQGGSKTDRALKALCRREKGLEVEEVTVNGVDCQGLELRVSSGIEVQTLRFQFNRKATCEKMADQLIDQLLNPRPGYRRPRRSQQSRPPRR